MSKFKTHLFCIIGGIIIGLLVAMGISRCHRQPVEPVKVERDTVYRYDTIPHYYPKPVGVTKTKTEYRWLPTAYHFRDPAKMMDSAKIPRDSASFPQDSVLVEVPIESRHYHSDEYDAWVSGYEPSLDSIFVRQKTEYINTTITKVVKDNKHFFVDVAGGCEYLFNNKSATPFAELGLTFKPSKWSIGVAGGYQHNGTTNTGEPYARLKLSYDLITF